MLGARPGAILGALTDMPGAEGPACALTTGIPLRERALMPSEGIDLGEKMKRRSITTSSGIRCCTRTYCATSCAELLNRTYLLLSASYLKSLVAPVVASRRIR